VVEEAFQYRIGLYCWNSWPSSGTWAYVAVCAVRPFLTQC